MKWDDVQQFIRILCYTAAGWLGNAGGLDPSNVETLGGAFLGLATVGWWLVWNKWFKKPAA